MKTYKNYLDEWNKLHCVCIVDMDTEGLECPVARSIYRNGTMADYCEKLLLRAKQLYYGGSPIMDDATFDRLEDCLKLLRPNSSILRKVG